MISAVAEQYEIHPQTLRLYEREGLLKPSRSDGNTRLYTDEDLERLEVILQADARSGRQPGRRRDHSEHAREDGGDAAQIEEFVRTLNTEFATSSACAGFAGAQFADPCCPAAA